MAWAEADRVQIRMYIGYSATFQQADSRLESAITSVQATADGGTRPDNSTELAIRGVIAQLQLTDQAIANLTPLYGASQLDEVSLDVARQDALLRKQARALVKRLCAFFDTRRYRDIYNPAEEYDSGTGIVPLPFGGRSGYSDR